MIDLNNYIINNSVKANRNTLIPKKYLWAFIYRYIPKKITTIFATFKKVFKSNETHKSDFQSFIDDNFALFEHNHSVAFPLTQTYEKAKLNADFPFFDSFENGLRIIKGVLNIEEINKEDFLKRLIKISYNDVEKYCGLNSPINCEINQDIFDFTIVRNCILNGEITTPEKIANAFYDLIHFCDLLPTLISSVLPANEQKCISAIKNTGLFQFGFPYEINNLDDLKTISIDSLLFYTGADIKMLVNLLNFYSEKEDDVLANVIRNYLKTVDVEDFEILSRREYETLDTIGKERNLTRERIRQFESNEIEKFQEFYNANFTVSNSNLLFFFPQTTSVFALNSQKDKMLGMYNCFRYLMQSIEYKGTAKYYKAIDAVVDSRRIWELFEETIRECFGEYFKKDKKDILISEVLTRLSTYGFNKEMVLLYINNEYKEKSGCLTRRGAPILKTYKLEFALKNYFDNGFHFSDLNDVIKMNKIVRDEFGDDLFDIDKLNKATYHSIVAIIERSNVQLVDRGTYKHISKSPQLNECLNDKIQKYINNKSSAVAYADIYETFKNELNDIGITNKYCLQGALFSANADFFRFERDYVLPIVAKQTLCQEMVNWMKMQPSFFTFNGFQQKFKGATYAVFANVLNKHGKTVTFWNKGYKNIEYLNVDAQTKERLNNLLTYQIKQYNKGYCSSDEIYNLVFEQMPEFINNFEISCSYDLFSILEYIFDSNYVFKRPLIGMQNAIFETDYEIVDNYVSSKNIVNLQSLRQFIDTKTANGNNYLTIAEIIANKWNEFVTIDIDTMVRKETLSIKEQELTRLNVLLDILLESKTEINIEEDIIQKHYFKEIAGFKINRYLVFGFINSFFHHKYKISTDGKNYRNGKFIVSK